jgi:uncharacterized protein YbaA (DUF1428 family)
MSYVDGFLLAVPTKNLGAYRRMARRAGKIWREHGALEYRECVGDDLKIKGTASFIDTTPARRGETVVFAWIVYKSRAHRDKVNARVMADPRISQMKPAQMPFDCSRMSHGGFKVLVDMA